MIYGETVVIGLDLKKIAGEFPRGVSYRKWIDEYNAFWPNYINENPHESLAMYAMGFPPESVMVGVRVDFYFRHFEEKSPKQFKRMLAREITKWLKTPVSADMIEYSYSTYILDEENV